MRKEQERRATYKKTKHRTIKNERKIGQANIIQDDVILDNARQDNNTYIYDKIIQDNTRQYKRVYDIILDKNTENRKCKFKKDKTKKII